MRLAGRGRGGPALVADGSHLHGNGNRKHASSVSRGQSGHGSFCRGGPSPSRVWRLVHGEGRGLMGQHRCWGQGRGQGRGQGQIAAGEPAGGTCVTGSVLNVCFRRPFRWRSTRSSSTRGGRHSSSRRSSPSRRARSSASRSD